MPAAEAYMRPGNANQMRKYAIAIVILATVGLVPAGAAVRIAEDGGGQIGAYLAKYGHCAPPATALKLTVLALRHAPCCSASFRAIASALRRAQVSSSTVRGTPQAIEPSPTTAIAYCGRATLKKCANGSCATAVCTPGSSR
jgi:hypothetical protein